MKKIISILVLICVLLTGSISCYAQYIDSNELGVSFYLSDNWENINDENSPEFYYNNNVWESVSVFAIDNDMAWSIDFFDENLLKELCEDLFSNNNLAEDLSEDNNNIYINISTDSVVTRYEKYNDVVYYRYEKAYTARSTGYYDKPLYVTAFVTAKNGKLYLIAYERDTEANHFSDVSELLDTISFRNGEVKIKINGETIYPDSAPMILEGRTLVPIRAVAEKMGYSVGWDEEYQLVSLSSASGFTNLFFMIGNNYALKYLGEIEEEIALDVPPIIFGDRTYLPLRAVAEAMDAHVEWNGSENTVEITY